MPFRGMSQPLERRGDELGETSTVVRMDGQKHV